MAAVITENPQSNESEATVETMNVESESAQNSTAPETIPNEDNSNGSAKRPREEDEAESEKDETLKKAKSDESVEEKEDEQKGEKAVTVKLGPKEFGSGEEMFNYFVKFLHYWPINLDINKYEHMALLDLIKKGHSEPDKKIGAGIQAFQIRYHPMWKSRCFFLLRVDETSDDFSFRKCVDQILPLPDNLKIRPSSNGNNKFGGHHKGGGGGGRGGRGRGRGGGFRK